MLKYVYQIVRGGILRLSITATEFKQNLGKYLTLAATEDIYITKNGIIIAKLVSPHQDKLKMVEELFGSVPDTLTLEEVREERLRKI